MAPVGTDAQDAGDPLVSMEYGDDGLWRFGQFAVDNARCRVAHRVSLREQDLPPTTAIYVNQELVKD